MSDYQPAKMANLLALAEMIELAARELAKEARKRAEARRPRRKRGATLRPSAETPLWNALAAAVKPHLAKRGNSICIAPGWASISSPAKRCRTPNGRCSCWSGSVTSPRRRKREDSGQCSYYEHRLGSGRGEGARTKVAAQGVGRIATAACTRRASVSSLRGTRGFSSNAHEAMCLSPTATSTSSARTSTPLLWRTRAPYL